MSPRDDFRLGIYGGTFDPPHVGHLILAEAAAESLELARVLFVPAADPPHKSANSVRASATHRLAMTKLAMAGNDHFAISRVDMRSGPNYSVDTLHRLRAEFPDAEFVFLIGGDSLNSLPTWHRPDHLIELAMLGVMRRPGSPEPDWTMLEEHIPGLRARVVWIAAPLIDIASSDLAQRLATGKTTRYQVPDAVLDYIKQHQLYT